MSNASRFYSLNDFLKERHQEKVMKLSLDGGYTCPNRDGKVASGGCIFCSSRGSGDFTSSSTKSITEQMQDNIELLSNKWPNVKKYMPYFQAYSSTYASLDILQKQYEEALSFPGVVGLAIATRPDCLEDDVLEYLSTLNQRTHLWVELGLQTIHPTTSKFINRGHDLACFEEAVYKLHHLGIEVVAHMIIGLPYESREDILATASYISKLPLQGVKMHMLHVVDNAPLGKLYTKEPFSLLSE
ncbi:MAG: TIGR01212 family radical SAM protein, partial [Niameybacter sp.]